MNTYECRQKKPPSNTSIYRYDADIGDYDGHIINSSVGVNLKISNHFGAGMSYNLLELDFGISDPSWRGELTSRSHGFYAYLSA